MSYRVLTTNRFEKAMKLCQKRNFQMQKLKDAICKLSENGCLPPEYKSHKLSNYPGGRRGNATSNRIGFLSGNRMTRNSFSSC